MCKGVGFFGRQIHKTRAIQKGNKRRMKIIRFFRWKCQGSYTLEAVFVIPLILGIIYAWMFALFYFHDRVVLDGIMQQRLIGRVGNMSEKTAMEIQEELEKKLWLLEINSLKGKESLGKYRYKLKAEVDWNIPVMRDFLKGVLDIGDEWSCYTLQPDYLLRMKE